MARLVLYENGPIDGAALKTALTANSIPFTEVRIDLMTDVDLPNIQTGTRDFGTNEMKALLRRIWLKVESL